MFNLRKHASGDCGGFKEPKGVLDTQMYPECKGKPGDRDIVKKTREKREKRDKKKKKESKKSFNLLDFKKEARFGGYLDHPNYDPKNGNIADPAKGKIWIDFRDPRYTPANPPTPEAAKTFVDWANQLVQVGLNQLLPEELQKDPAIVNGLKRVMSTPQGTPEEVIQKSFDYAGYFHQIEAQGWVHTPVFEKQQNLR